MKVFNYYLFFFGVLLMNFGKIVILFFGDLILVKKVMNIFNIWVIFRKLFLWNIKFCDMYCMVFLFKERKKWFGNFCIFFSEEMCFDMGVWDEVFDEEYWGDCSKEEIGYWSVILMFIYLMMLFIIYFIKNYVVEIDCNLGDGIGY